MKYVTEKIEEKGGQVLPPSFSPSTSKVQDDFMMEDGEMSESEKEALRAFSIRVLLEDGFLMEENGFPEEVRKALHDFSERILVEVGPVRFPE